MKRVGIKSFCIACVIIFFSMQTVYAEEMEVKKEPEVSDELARDYVSHISDAGKVYFVKQDGTGDFTSIQQGVDQVNNQDVLIIYPGIYEENVEIKGKTVNLVGIDRDTCILTSNTKNYFYIPLTLGAGFVANLTILGYDAGYNEDIYYELQKVEDDYIRKANEFPGYSIHVDTDYSENKELTFLDCKVICDTNCCLGIGTRPGNRIMIEQCEFISKKTSGGIFYHNSKYEGDSTLIVKNTSFNIDAPINTFILQSVSDVNEVTLKFEEVKVYDSNNKEYCVGAVRTEQYKSGNLDKMETIDEDMEVDSLEEKGWNGLDAFSLDPSSKDNSLTCMNH